MMKKQKNPEHVPGAWLIIAGVIAFFIKLANPDADLGVIGTIFSWAGNAIILFIIAIVLSAAIANLVTVGGDSQAQDFRKPAMFVLAFLLAVACYAVCAGISFGEYIELIAQCILFGLFNLFLFLFLGLLLAFLPGSR